MVILLITVFTERVNVFDDVNVVVPFVPVMDI
jgi:hypothetical protein